MRKSSTTGSSARSRAPGSKSVLLASAAGFACIAGLVSTPAAAQEEDVTEILVTGSRIVRDGNDAPTPVSVISAEEIATEVPANIADFVNTLPSVSGSQTAVSNSGSLSNGKSGISALNLRSLGQNRTLVLLDGQRSVASTSDGLVDINTFPQALIERVEVVTGGASSVYGSDAVAGVVNFILKKDFEGIEAKYEYGVTTYSDIPNHKVQLTAGTSFDDDRGHITLSGEYFTQDGKHFIDRDWNNTGYFQINNPNYTDENGEPYRLVLPGVGSSNFTPGGLVTDGPLQGYYFGAIDPATGRATLNQLAYGTVAGSWMIGGDYNLTSANHRGSNSLANDEERISAFGRIEYEFADWFNLFAQASYTRYEGFSIYQQTPSVNVVIQADNAFLPDEMRDLMAQNNLTSIKIGTSNFGIPGSGGDNKREVQRYVVGANGDFSTGPIDWRWDGYYQHGATDTRETLSNTWLNSRLNAMADAVYDGPDNIVCRVNADADPTNDLPGCVPINRLGMGGITQEALDFLFAIYPEREQYVRQDVGGINFSTGSLFENWAGPVSLAFGAEYREESIDGYTDPMQFNPDDRWLYGNYQVTKGSYNVKEAYIETLFPLYEGLEFNGAVRFTDYSISGSVTTWKAGLTWQPIPDIRLRGTISRDIRAPNLSELFDPGTARTNSVNVPDGSGGVRAEEFVQNFTGSLDLTPEIAKTYGIGVVFMPSFAPGFSLAVDYFDITIDDAISSVTAQKTADLCFEQNIQEYCDNIEYAAGSTTDISTINLSYVNFAEQSARGFDIEASYRRPIGPGTLALRALGTYTIENVIDNGIDAPNDRAGVNAGGIPTFSYRVSAGYDFDSGLGINFIGRGFSNGVYDNDYIECTSGCPATDPVARTINNNHIDGTLYIDANMNYTFDLGPTKTEAFFSVKNLFDRDPVLIGNGPDGNNTPAYPQTSRSLYDTLGRTFRIGLRVKY